MQTDEMKDVAGIQADAVKLKFIDKPLSKEQLTELIQNSAAYQITNNKIR